MAAEPRHTPAAQPKARRSGDLTGGPTGRAAEVRRLVWTRDEWRRAAQASREEPRDHALLWCLYGLGMRSSEALGLRWEDWDREGGMVAFRRRKVGDSHLLPVPEPVAEALGAWWARSRLDGLALRPRGFVFPGRKGALHRSTVRDVVRRWGAAAGVDERKWRPHALRHSRATHFVDAGEGLSVVQTLLGHANPSTTAVYVHVSGAELRRAFESVDGPGR